MKVGQCIMYSFIDGKGVKSVYVGVIKNIKGFIFKTIVVTKGPLLVNIKKKNVISIIRS